MTIGAIFTDLAAAVGGLFVQLFTTLSAIFFSTEVGTDGLTGFTLTPIGYIAFFSLIFAVTTTVLNIIMRFFKARKS